MAQEDPLHGEAPADPAGALPLCVDLDGTLIATDSLVELVMSVLRKRPFALWRLPVWLARGRAVVKTELAAIAVPDAAQLPYRQEVVAYLREARSDGREVVLATASDQRVAEAVASLLGVFDRVLGSEDGHNLKGARKRDALVAAFGTRGYEYIGDSASDLPVWQAAGRASCVGIGRRRRAQVALHTPIGRCFEVEPSGLRVWLEEMRVSQWVKNVLVFFPMAMAHQLDDPALWVNAGLAFVCLSLLASAVYLLNDLYDLPSDRVHATKRNRPFARGALSLWGGIGLAPLLTLASLGLGAWLLPTTFVLTLVVYGVLNVLYSVWLKRVALADVVMLSVLYTLRVVAGTEATGVPYSPWLLGFSLFFFLNLAFLKRYADLRTLVGTSETRLSGRGYQTGDARLLLALGPAAGLVATLVLALYVQSDRVHALYGQPALLWLAIPLVAWWVARLWRIAHRGQIRQDPVSFTLRDPASWATAVVGAGVVVAAAVL